VAVDEELRGLHVQSQTVALVATLPVAR
jgi:hypothetical protein